MDQRTQVRIEALSGKKDMLMQRMKALQRKIDAEAEEARRLANELMEVERRIEALEGNKPIEEADDDGWPPFEVQLY